MKKFILMMAVMFTALTMNAQTNYAGSSRFTDNMSVTLQGGVLTTMDNMFAGHTAMTPTVVLGVDKYINPWLGVGVEGRTSIGTGEVGVSRFNSHTVFDAVNVSGYVKFNLANLLDFNGTRHFFEPVVYTGLGWGHTNCGCSDNSISNNYAAGANGVPTEMLGTGVRNYVTYRSGVECNFNLGKEKAWAIVVNPSVVWGNVDNGRLDKRNGNFEITVGAVYHFKTSNGTRSFAKAHLYDQAEVDRLNARIHELENQPVKVVERVIEKQAPTAAVGLVQNTFVVPFAFDSSEITEKGKAELDKIGQNSVVVIDAYASREPNSNEEYNLGLTQQRANVVKAYLENRGVKVDAANFHGCDDNYGRVAIVTYK